MESTIPQEAARALARPRQPVARERQPLEARVFSLGFGRDRFVVPSHAGWSRLVCAAGGSGIVRTSAGYGLLDRRHAYGIGEEAPVEVQAARHLDLRIVYLRRVNLASGCYTMTPLAGELIERAVVRGWLDPATSRDANVLAVLFDELSALEPAVRVAQVAMPLDPRALTAADAWLGSGTERLWSAFEFAAAAGCGARTFERLFMRETGLGVVAWQRRMRLLAAAAAVAAGAAVTAAGLDAGYADTSAFVTAFRRAFGMTPGRLSRL